jgi:hypothetical protein
MEILEESGIGVVKPTPGALSVDWREFGEVRSDTGRISLAPPPTGRPAMKRLAMRVPMFGTRV